MLNIWHISIIVSMWRYHCWHQYRGNFSDKGHRNNYTAKYVVQNQWKPLMLHNEAITHDQLSRQKKRGDEVELRKSHERRAELFPVLKKVPLQRSQSQSLYHWVRHQLSVWTCESWAKKENVYTHPRKLPMTHITMFEEKLPPSGYHDVVSVWDSTIQLVSTAVCLGNSGILTSLHRDSDWSSSKWDAIYLES